MNSWTVMPNTKAFEHWPITAKIATSVSLLVALAVAVSLVGLYGLQSMQKAVDTAGHASEVLVSVNTATERVEHFIASHDPESLVKAKTIMADTANMFTTLASSNPDEASSLTTGLKQFSKAIDTLRMATDIMDTETSNMTTNHGQLRNVATEIEQDIEKRRKLHDKQAAAHDVLLRTFQDGQRILRIIHSGERTATAGLARRLIGGKATDAAEAGNACKALLPVVDMLAGLLDAPEWSASLTRLKISVTQAEQAIGGLTDAPAAKQLPLGNEALQRLEATHEIVAILEGMAKTKEESFARTTDDLRTESGLLQNAAKFSERFAERVAKLEAQTLAFRLSPTDKTAGLVIDILDQLTRFARILPSLGSSQGSASVLTVTEQLDGYRTAFDRFREASTALDQAHDQVRQEAARTSSLVTGFANEQRTVAADNRRRGAFVTVLASVIAVLIALVVANHTSRVIARPIVALAAVMRRLADGHLEDRIVGLHRGDELGSMTRAVKVFQDNAMRVRALEAEAEAERQRVLVRLENMVAERTRDLQTTNHMLQREIVERTRAEEEVRRLNEELEQKVEERTRQVRRLVDSNIIGIFFWDLAGGITEVNDAFLAIVGYSRQDVREGKVRWTEMTPPEWRETDAKAVAELLATGKNRPYEKEYVQKDGNRVPVLLGGALYEGSRDRGVAFVLDLTSQKRAESALLAAQEELVRKEKLAILGQLSGSVGHELRNPLGVMSNAVYFLNMVLTDADETVKEYLGIIKKEIDNSLRIITDLLDFARTKAPRIKAVTARALVEESLGRCTVPETVELHDVVPRDLPALAIDPLQMGQVLQNLIQNGVQAMPAGGTITLRAARDGEGLVRLEIADTGEGISPENMKRLFQPLFTTKAKGIGLGLVVCRNLTEANGGLIEVASELGKGTTFAVLLPVERAET